MESRTVLDYAMFHLTPTRTRCDLAIFAGKNCETIASGLLEPYLSNLRSAKDQFSKGGYSIKLKPADSDDDGPSWFTKATLERFVRFVETPEVLERFVTIEREVKQIVGSIEPSERANGRDHSNPKVRLQSVLESRKAVLRKEQSMAYARAVVMGFDTDSIYDLLSFGDAFGAVRLREACTNLIELCHKKNDDAMWTDEVAMMQESYDNGSETNHGAYDGREEQVQEKTDAWVNSHPHGSMYRQIPPYHGYLLHPRNGVCPGNFWDPTSALYDGDSEERKTYKGSKKKNKCAPKYSSESETDDDDDTNEKLSLRKVVVRNVNYYNNVDAYLSDEEDGGDGCNDDSDLIRRKVDDDENVDEGTVRREGEKEDSNWNIFENMLIKSSSETKDRSSALESFDGVVRKDVERYYEELPIPPRIEEECVIESSDVVNCRKEGDLFVGYYKPEIPEEIDREDVWRSSRRRGNVDEPEDLRMMVRRDSAAPPEQAVRSWNPEMDRVGPADGKSPFETVRIPNKTDEDNMSGKRRPSTKTARKTNSKTKSNVSRKVKSEADKEEEKRKKLEELKTQRQKRIAERTAASETSKKQPNQRAMTKKNAVVAKKTEKIAETLKGPTDDIKKPIIMSKSTINRLSTARTSSTKSRLPVRNEKAAPKKSSVSKASSPKTVKVNNTPSLKRTATTSVSNKSKARSDYEEVTTAVIPKNGGGNEDFEDVKVLHTVISVEKTAAPEGSTDDHCKGIGEEPCKGEAEDRAMTTFGGKNGDGQKKKLRFSPEVTVVCILSTPPDNTVVESNGEADRSRKKWSFRGGDGSAKAPTGFRKLLFFGRNS